MNIERLRHGILAVANFEIQAVQQPDDHTCVHSSLAALTGLSCETLIKRFGRGQPLSRRREITVLTEMGILPTPISSLGGGRLTYREVYLVSVPSLNFMSGMHRLILVPLHDELFYVYDPNRGRPDRKAYPENYLDWERPGFVEGYMLESMGEHRGTQERQKLYKKRHRRFGRDCDYIVASDDDGPVFRLVAQTFGAMYSRQSSETPAVKAV